MPKFTGFFSPKKITLPASWTAKNIGMSWAGDLNADGFEDFILAGATYPENENFPQQGYIFFGDDSTGFTVTPENLFPLSALRTVHPYALIVEDFNSDGRKDLFVANFGYDKYGSWPGEQNQLFLSLPNGSWKHSTINLPQIIDNSHGASAGDVDGDGDIDIYVNNTFGGPKSLPYLLTNNGNGIFTKTDSILPVRNNQLLDTYGSLSNQFTASFISDLDNDGLQDLILGSIGGPYPKNGSLVLWNTGGGFDQSVVSAMPPGRQNSIDYTTVDAASLDVNNDGLKDIIFLSTKVNPYYEGTFVDVYLNEGSRRFVNKTQELLGAAASRDNGGWSQSIDILDANNDGFLDIVISKYWAKLGDKNSTAMFLNKGNGSFIPVTLGDLTDTPDLISFNATPLKTKHGLSFISTSFGADDKGLLGANILEANKPLPKFSYGTAEADFQGTHTEYKVSKTANSITVTDSISNRDSTQTLLDIQQRLKFSDGVVAFDIQNTPDNALTYRLYQAAFARTPDEGGLRFWIDTHNKGVSINDIGSAFLNSAEFKQKYGANSTNSQLVDLLYKNILGREGEAGGVKYWNGVLDSGQSTKEQVLIGFAGSPENVAKTAANIDNGYWLI